MQEEWKIEDACKYAHYKRMKPLLTRHDVDIRSQGRDITLTRYLGHKVDMPGSGQWELNTMSEIGDCWVCDNWMNVIVFWNPAIGRFNDINSINIDIKTKTEVVQQVRMTNPETYRDHPEVPVLYSNINSWKGRAFMPILDFLN